MERNSLKLEKAEGTLGIMLVGLGAVSTTFAAGIHLIRKNLAQPIGSQAWMGSLEREGVACKIHELLPLARPESLKIAAWDIFSDNGYEAALKAGVLRGDDLNKVKEELRSLVPIKGAFDRTFVRNLDGDHIKQGTRLEMAEALRSDSLLLRGGYLYRVRIR